MSITFPLVVEEIGTPQVTTQGNTVIVTWNHLGGRFKDIPIAKFSVGLTKSANTPPWQDNSYEVAQVQAWAPHLDRYVKSRRLATLMWVALHENSRSMEVLRAIVEVASLP